MKNKIALGALVFVAFIAIIVAVIAKDAENQRKTDEIIANTIKNGLEDDDGYSMDEISNAFSKEALESAGYKNLADIAYAKTDGDTIRLVFADCEIENDFYLATRLIDESGGKTLLITWNGADYEINKGKVGGNEELVDMFPDEWVDVVRRAYSGDGLQLGTDIVDEIDKEIEKLLIGGAKMKLKTDFYEVDILGYFDWSGAIRVDIKLNNYGELKEFLKFVSEHGEQNGLFDFEIGEEAFRGHCGMYYYDRTYNIRLIMISTSDEEYARGMRSTTLLFENLERVLDG